MTRSERQIRDAATAVGIKLSTVEWEPIGPPPVRGAGPSGGWLVIEADRDDGAPGEWFSGYNVAAVIQAIEHRAQFRFECERKASLAAVLH